MTVTILLVDDCAVTRNMLRKLIELEAGMEVVGEAENGLVAVEKAKELRPDLVVMDVNMPVMNGMEATEKITESCPDTTVVICSVQGERDYQRKAKSCGATDYLVKPISTDQLLGTVNNLYSLEQKRQARRLLEQQQEESAAVQSHVVTLLSAKGGVGKTTIATNLAVTAARLGKSVCVLDLDMQFGDTAMYMDLSSARSNLGTLIRSGEPLSRAAIRSCLIPHESGAQILAAPLHPEEKSMVSSDHAEEILMRLSEMFELVIVDTAPAPNDICFSVLAHSDTIGLVSTPNLPVLKNNAQLLEQLLALGVEEERIQVLLNRSLWQTGIEEREVVELLQREVAWELPSDSKTVDASQNEGIPFAWKDPEHSLSQHLVTLLHQLQSTENGQTDHELWQLFG